MLGFNIVSLLGSPVEKGGNGFDKAFVGTEPISVTIHLMAVKHGIKWLA